MSVILLEVAADVVGLAIIGLAGLLVGLCIQASYILVERIRDRRIPPEPDGPIFFTLPVPAQQTAPLIELIDAEGNVIGVLR